MAYGGDRDQTGLSTVTIYCSTYMLRELEKGRLGVTVDGSWCGALLYADDVVLLIAETVQRGIA